MEVGIAAYWEKGDVFTYQYTNEKYKVDERGDTTYVSRSGNLKTMKVVSMTDDTYTLKITSSDSWHSDPERSKLLERIRTIYKRRHLKIIIVNLIDGVIITVKYK